MKAIATYTMRDGTTIPSLDRAKRYAMDKACGAFDAALVRIELIPSRSRRALSLAEDPITRNFVKEALAWVEDAELEEETQDE